MVLTQVQLREEMADVELVSFKSEAQKDRLGKLIVQRIAEYSEEEDSLVRYQLRQEIRTYMDQL